MQTISLQQAFESVKSSSLIKNTGWALSTEAAARISRLLPIIVLANYLTPAEYGVAMLSLSLHEIFRVFMRSGCGNKVVQCNEADLKVILQNASLFQWLTCSLLCGLQMAVAPFVATYFNSPSLSGLLQIMALSYLFYPLVSGKAFWMLRNNNLKTYNIFLAVCLIVENITSSTLAVAGAGIMAVAYAKIISSTAWVLLYTNHQSHPFGSKLCTKTFSALGKFSFSVLGVEMIRSLRAQLDIIIAGKLLVHDLLGAYCFAKSIGLGISQSLIAAYTGSLFPQVCTTLREGKEHFNPSKILKITAVIALIFAVQTAALPLYSAVIFHTQWHDYALTAMILCSSAIPMLYMDTLCCILRAKLRIKFEFFLTAISIASLLLITFQIAPQTPVQMAYCVLLASCLWVPIYFFDNKMNITANRG